MCWYLRRRMASRFLGSVVGSVCYRKRCSKFKTFVQLWWGCEQIIRAHLTLSTSVVLHQNQNVITQEANSIHFPFLHLSSSNHIILSKYTGYILVHYLLVPAAYWPRQVGVRPFADCFQRLSVDIINRTRGHPHSIVVFDFLKTHQTSFKPRLSKEARALRSSRWGQRTISWTKKASLSQSDSVWIVSSAQHKRFFNTFTTRRVRRRIFKL